MRVKAQRSAPAVNAALYAKLGKRLLALATSTTIAQCREPEDEPAMEPS